MHPSGRVDRCAAPCCAAKAFRGGREFVIKSGRKAKIRIAVVAGVVLAGLGVATVTQVAEASEQPAPRAVRITLPPEVAQAIQNLTPGAGFVPTAAHVVTSGTQTYTCQADGTWSTGSTPEANLKKLLGLGPSTVHHFGGPRWAAPDGSTVLAAVQNRVPRDGQLPWLLLNVTAHEGPAGAMDSVTHITRVLTRDGLAPPGSCVANETVSPSYTAVYVFWAAG